MKHLITKMSSYAIAKGKLALAILTIALFALAAGAPNATIGIGR